MKGNGVIFNAYPDSIGENLSDLVSVLEEYHLKDFIETFYILPSVFNTDLDRGFSVIDYQLNQDLVSSQDMERLKEMGIDLKLDFILNHASVLSKEFQDVLKKGKDSEYIDFFINWNTFWEGYGQMGPDGYIIPDKKYLSKMFFRKEGLPILMVRLPDGSQVPFWNTFYQEIQYPKMDPQRVMKVCQVQYGVATRIAACIARDLAQNKGLKDMDFGRYQAHLPKIIAHMDRHKRYLGQMDLNIQSSKVWDYYKNVIGQLAGYGAKIVRLDAFAYAPKSPGQKNFLNEPDTWDVLERVQGLAKEHNLVLLPEIHATYEEGIYEKVASKGYITYDFFLPGLVIDALEKRRGEILVQWANEICQKKLSVVNMLGCHDGIPLLDLKGLLSDTDIQYLIDCIVERGGYVKNLHGQKNMYYQVNATYYSALGEDDRKMLLARGIQMFMPGRPQVWYLDLFGGKNDYKAVQEAGAGGHKEINRTNLSLSKIKRGISRRLVQKQLLLLGFRNSCPAFSPEAKWFGEAVNGYLHMRWEHEGHIAVLNIDLYAMSMRVYYAYDGKKETIMEV